MLSKYFHSAIEAILWLAVVGVVFYVSVAETDSLLIRLACAAAISLAGYWTIRALRDRRESDQEKEQIRFETREVRYQKERWEAFLELSHDGIIILDKDHHILKINQAITEITGYDNEEALGRACSQVFRTKKYKDLGITYGLGMLTEQNPSYYEELSIETKDGRPIDVGVASAPAKKHPGHRGAFLILLRDLTKIHEAEALEHDFVSMTSHQLFTPLSIIRGHVSMLLAGDIGKLAPKQKYFLNQSMQAAKRMVHLISELLSISRLEERKITLNFATTTIDDVIKPLVSEMKTLANHAKIKLIYKKPAHHLPNISIDSEKITQVLQNLIDNAIKYSPSGSTVTVETQVRSSDVVVSVTDSGIGVPAADVPKLFQRFFRSGNAINLDTRGTGLGLYIARVIVERHNGKIWVDSHEGKGSTFAFSLPR